MKICALGLRNDRSSFIKVYNRNLAKQIEYTLEPSEVFTTMIRLMEKRMSEGSSLSERIDGICNFKTSMTDLLKIPLATPPTPTPQHIPQTASFNNTITIAVNSSIPNNELYYAPSPATVPIGTNVTWTNADKVMHTVTSTDRTFDSEIIQPDSTFKHVFKILGIFDITTLHSHMKGKLIVK